jgi:hypothetical protein
MTRMASRNDSAHHRNQHDAGHPMARGARLARHLAIAAWRPCRALQEVLDEVERCRCPLNSVVLMRARIALEGAMPYLQDDTGEVWK